MIVDCYRIKNKYFKSMDFLPLSQSIISPTFDENMGLVVGVLLLRRNTMIIGDYSAVTAFSQ
jgi:hypothetical protein